MKKLYDDISFACNKQITLTYSTSFATAVRLLSPSIRQDIYNIYGFVRLADEIVDSFHDYDKQNLFDQLREAVSIALSDKISINPILNAFQYTVAKYAIPRALINDFLQSMETDLTKKTYGSREEFERYVYGSADVVGLMCLIVFVNGDAVKYEELKGAAMRLGSAFQKVNFLRDVKADYELLGRIYFPRTDFAELDDTSKNGIVNDIEADMKQAYLGIVKLPIEARLGVYVAYIYYRKLLTKLKKMPSAQIKTTRIRVPDYQKYGLFAKCYVNYKLKLI